MVLQSGTSLPDRFCVDAVGSITEELVPYTGNGQIQVYDMLK